MEREKSQERVTVDMTEFGVCKKLVNIQKYINSRVRDLSFTLLTLDFHKINRQKDLQDKSLEPVQYFKRLEVIGTNHIHPWFLS